MTGERAVGIWHLFGTSGVGGSTFGIYTRGGVLGHEQYWQKFVEFSGHFRTRMVGGIELGAKNAKNMERNFDPAQFRAYRRLKWVVDRWFRLSTGASCPVACHKRKEP